MSVASRCSKSRVARTSSYTEPRADFACRMPHEILATDQFPREDRIHRLFGEVRLLLPRSKAYLIEALSQLKSTDFRLLLGLTIIAIVEGITYAWIEVLLYTSDNPLLFNTWILGHYSSYHAVLTLLVLAMIFGTGFVSWSTYSPTRFRKFFLLALGDFVLWILTEDEFTFIFSHATHTATDWTNWPVGAIDISGHYVPIWYVAAAISIFVLWSLGLGVPENDTPLPSPSTTNPTAIMELMHPSCY